MTSLPMVLILPGSFNLYFLFGSLNLNAALAFWYGPITYFKQMMEESRRIVSIIYLCSLLLCLYIALFKGGYILSLVGIALQVFALSVVVKQAVTGEANSSWASRMMFSSFQSMFSRKEPGLPF